MMSNLLAVGAGGAAGSMLRYLCSRSLPFLIFPYSTLFVNILGCFLVGLLAGYFLKNNVQSSLPLLLITGFCGGFTTFSAFTLESVKLAQKGQWALLFLYIGISVLAGLMAAFLGLKIYS